MEIQQKSEPFYKATPQSTIPQKAGLTVGDLLQTSYFHDHQLLAGHNGLTRLVKWIHPYDITLKIREFVYVGQRISIR